MTREEAEAERERLQQDDHDHTYVAREQAVGDCEVLRLNLPHRTSDVVAERGKPADLREDPRPFIVRQVPPYGPGFG